MLCALQGPRHQLVPPGCPGAPPGCPGAPSGAPAGPGPQVRHGRVTGRNLRLYHQREDALVNGRRKLSTGGSHRRRRTLRERQRARRVHVAARPLPWERRCGAAIALARRGSFITVSSKLASLPYLRLEPELSVRFSWPSAVCDFSYETSLGRLSQREGRGVLRKTSLMEKTTADSEAGLIVVVFHHVLGSLSTNHTRQTRKQNQLKGSQSAFQCAKAEG
eukprot:bmy_04759T0